MVKLYGGSRKLKNGSRQYTRRENEFHEELASGSYSSGYFSQKVGGYYVVEKSKASHKSEELEAVRFMADQGYIVTLKDEGSQQHKIKTPDGYIFTASFEQRTPDGSKNTAENIMGCLRHGRDKKADVTVIYQKYGRHSRADIEKGIRLYEEKSRHRFKQIIIVTKDGRIHRHKHNDT